MQKVSIYFNKRAANTRWRWWEKEIKRQLFRSQLYFHAPDSFAQLKMALEEDLREKVDVVISIGGDGTVNTLIQYLAGTEIAFLVIPAGTANDLAHELATEPSQGKTGDDVGQEIHQKKALDRRKILQCVRLNDTKQIDLIHVQGASGRLMATNGGLGAGSSVANKINSLRSKFPSFKKLMRLTGKGIYSGFLVGELLSPNFQYQKLQILSSEFEGELEVAILMINNQSRVAGTFTVAPYTSNSDGKFNVTIFKHKNRLQLMKCIYLISTNRYPENDPDLISFETNFVKITSLQKDQDLFFFGDGEIFESSPVLEISVKREALKVFRQIKDGTELSYELKLGETL